MPCSPGFICPKFTEKKPCPAGKYCAGAGADAKDCAFPAYCPQGSSKQQICPDGTECPDPATSNLCPAGVFCTGGVKTPCPAGSYCPAKSAAPKPCAADTYCPAGAASATPCPSGTKSAAGSGSASDCQVPGVSVWGGTWVKYENYALTVEADSWANMGTTFDGTNAKWGGKVPYPACYGGRCSWDLNSTWPIKYNQLSPFGVPDAIPGVDMNMVVNPGDANGPKNGDRDAWVANAKRIPKVIGICTVNQLLFIYAKDANQWGNKLYLKPMNGFTSYVLKGSPLEGRFSP